MVHNEKNIQMAKQIAGCVRDVGGSTYYVGGYVRDSVLGRDSKDIDIEIHGISPEALEKIPEDVRRACSHGQQFWYFGTATL